MRTLLIRFSALGDVVLTLPALADLSAAGHRLQFLTLDRFLPLLSQLPQLEKVHGLDPSGGPPALRRMAGRLREERFDAVLDLHDNLRSRTLRMWMAGSGARWIRTRRDGLRRRLLVAAPDRWKAALRERPFSPVAERHRAAAARLGAEASELKYLIPLRREVREDRDRDLEARGLREGVHPLGIAPAAAWAGKIWPHFESFAAKLPAKLPLLVLGGPGEEELCRRVADAAGARARVVAGGISLPGLADSLARCRALVSGDSGLAHLAEAVGTPVCVLFGPTVPEFGFAPGRQGSLLLQRDLPCRPCSLHGRRACKFGDSRCLDGLEPETVLAALRERKWLE